MPITAPANPTEEDILAIAKFLLQTSYDDGVGDLTIARSANGFTGQFVDRTDVKKIFEYEIVKSDDDWEVGYQPISGVGDDEEEAQFGECWVAPIWNPAPFDFEAVDYVEEEGEAEEYAESKIRVGTTVTWKYGTGTATGKVVKIYRDRITLKLGDSEVTRNGSDENPAVLVEQENGARALKLASVVNVGADYAEREEEPVKLASQTNKGDKKPFQFAEDVDSVELVEKLVKSGTSIARVEDFVDLCLGN